MPAMHSFNCASHERATIAASLPSSRAWDLCTEASKLEPRGASTAEHCASLTLRWRVSRPGVTSSLRYLAQLTSLALYFCIGRILGPLILMPVPLMIHTTLHALSGHAGHRLFSVVSSCSLLRGMVVLEQLGVLAPSYAANGDGLLVLADLARLPLGHTQVLLTGICLLTIVLCSLSLSRLPQRLLAAERQQALHAWQMRLLLDENQASAPPHRPAPENPG